MSCTKSIAIIIIILIFIVMVIYDTYSNEESIFRISKTKTKNSSSKGRKTHHINDHFTKRERVVELQRTIDNMRAHYGIKTSQKLENRTSQHGQKGNQSADTRKVVLAYTAYFGNKPWQWMKNSYEFNHWEGIRCPYYSCELTFNRRDRKRSDALIFHARDMPFIDTMRYILDRKDPKQRWIYFAMESPMNNPMPMLLDYMFNWTMSYRKDSDIFRPYTYYFESPFIPKMPVHTYLEGKDRFVFWTSSHCGLKRDNYVEKLLEYIKVDVFGACRTIVGAEDVGRCPPNSPECEKTLRRYKFQLAFENTNCVDYVTEKYWDGIKKGIVPVVIGGAHYDQQVVIPGSFINVMDYKSVKDLADYLVFLDKNDTAYLQYFTWKSKYRVTNYPPWNCQLCARLHLDMEPKIYKRMEPMWSAEKNCGINDNVLKGMIHTLNNNNTKTTKATATVSNINNNSNNNGNSSEQHQ